MKYFNGITLKLIDAKKAEKDKMYLKLLIEQ